MKDFGLFLVLGALALTGCGDDAASGGGSSCQAMEAAMACACPNGAQSTTFCDATGTRQCNCQQQAGSGGAVNNGSGGAVNNGSGGAINNGSGGTVNNGTGGTMGTGGTTGTGGMTMNSAGCDASLMCAENSFVAMQMPGFNFCGMAGGIGHSPPACAGANMDDCSAFPGSTCQDLIVIKGCIKPCTP